MTPTARRLRLLNAGYLPVPVVGKHPPFEEWQKKTDISANEIKSWESKYPFAASDGLLTQSMPTFDIDIKNQEASEAVEALIRERFDEHGRILVRIGNAPKRAIPFRTDKPFKKIATNFLAPDATTDQKVEFLCDGQQLVALGLHKDTKQPYRWFGGEPGEIKLDELPFISEAEAKALRNDAVNLLADFGYQPTAARPPRDLNGNAFGSADWSYLIENIRAGHELHDLSRDLAAKLVVAGMGGGAAVNMLYAELDQSNAPRDQRFKERRDDIPKLVTSAQEKFGVAAATLKFEGRLLQSSAEFVANFMPPDYLVDGLLQRRYVYSLTAPTGTGKTGIVLRLAGHVSLGLKLANMEVEKGRVLYFAGENPDDVRTRWIKQCEDLKQNPDEMDVVFLPGAPPISEKAIRAKIDAEATEHGPFSLVIVDTSAAYFRGDDENSNAQLARHARMMRSFVELPGGPTVLVTCHPTKNFDPDNLLPRGGGAFLNEVDGNLVCLKEAGSVVVTLDTHGKFRGPEFEPFSFKLVAGKSDKLKDTKGRHVSTVTAEPITQDDRAALEDSGRGQQDQLLAMMATSPGLSLSELAEALGWFYKNGNGGPDTSRVHRLMGKLANDRLLAKKRNNHYELTKKGVEAGVEIKVKPNPAQSWLDELGRKANVG